jgi:L-fucose isomerase-like protein
METKKPQLTRREFVGITAMASGSLAFVPGSLSSYFFGPEQSVRSAVYTTPLSVKFVHTGVIHEEAYEGSCRVGNLKNMTMEAETAENKRGLEKFTNQVKEYTFGPGIEVLTPQGIYLWVEKGNPEIMLKDQELYKLNDDDRTADVYVVTGGLPQFTCVRIAERYKKPVIFLSSSGWGLDVPAGLRAIGTESFYVQNMDQLNDILMVFKARKAFRNTKFLNVTNFDVVPKGVISSIRDLDFIKDKYGMDYHTVNYKEFFSEMDRLLKDRDIVKKSQEMADALSKGAGASNMTSADIVNSFNFYLTILHFFNKYECNAFGVECFELCSSMNPWNRRFTPCMTHSLLKNEGFPSACEKDLNALLAMAAMMYVTNKPAYMGNPNFDLKNNIITLNHSDSPTKMTGFGQPDGYYEIKSFADAGFGVNLRYDYEAHKGQVVTLSRFDPSAKKMLVIPGEISGGGGMEGIGCSQEVSIRVKDSREAMREMQVYGHHLSLVYGDCTEQIRDLGELMDFGVVKV